MQTILQSAGKLISATSRRSSHISQAWAVIVLDFCCYYFNYIDFHLNKKEENIGNENQDFWFS